MIIIKQIYPSLVDVFYGDKEFKAQEWARFTRTKQGKWKVLIKPAISNQDEIDYGCIKSINKAMSKIINLLEKKDGKPSQK